MTFIRPFKVLELISEGESQATLTRDDFRVICLDVLKRMLVPIREAAYGAHLQLPFETLADEALEVAEKSTKKTKRPQVVPHQYQFNSIWNHPMHCKLQIISIQAIAIAFNLLRPHCP